MITEYKTLIVTAEDGCTIEVQQHVERKEVQITWVWADDSRETPLDLSFKDARNLAIALGLIVGVDDEVE